MSASDGIAGIDFHNTMPAVSAVEGNSLVRVCGEPAKWRGRSAFLGFPGILAGSSSSERMMIVKRTHTFDYLQAAAATLSVLLALGGGMTVCAQASAPSSALNPFFGSVLARRASSDELKLSLDEAVRMGLENNLGLKEAENGEKTIQGQKNQALQNFLPNITVGGDLGVHQTNLAALGFGPSVIGIFAPMFPGGKIPAGMSYITRDDLTEGKVQFGQMLFSGPVIAAYKGAQAAERAAYFGKTSARGEVVQQVASAYLHALAASSEVDNARALEAADRVALDQAHAAHEAGTAANLDELRARVQWQAQQQAVIAAENALQKELILLKREIGIDPGQKLALTDPAPYSELAAQTPDEVRTVAYQNRQDYKKLQNEEIEMRAIHAAYRAQRLPSLSFGGFYAVSKVNGVSSHGNFVTQGNLSVPLFREAGLRGQIGAAQAQLNATDSQLADLRGQIDYQVRVALLDVDASAQLVQVSRSNVDLATRALADETDRVKAGVDDNLPLVTAQATLASAQTNLVESLYQYNLSKLALARSAGILEAQYRVYLGR
jgi:outer membrane protein TolC